MLTNSQLTRVTFLRLLVFHGMLSIAILKECSYVFVFRFAAFFSVGSRLVSCW